MNMTRTEPPFRIIQIDSEETDTPEEIASLARAALQSGDAYEAWSADEALVIALALQDSQGEYND